MTTALAGRFGTAFEWLGVERAWTRTRGSPSVVIAVIDQGIQSDHPLLGPNIQRDSVEHRTSGDHEIPGTHAAGIAAGRSSDTDGFSGIAPDARILPVRFGSGDPQSLDLSHAIEYAVEAGASIINLSNAGNPAQPAALRAIQYAAARNVLVVCAANASIAAVRAREADDPVPNQISVLSVNQRFHPHDGAATDADIFAPSFARVPEWRGSGHCAVNDAAVGAAYVSGCAALVKSKNPGWGYHEVKEHLLASAGPKRLLNVADAVVGPIEIETGDEPMVWSSLNDAVLRWKLRYRSAYCANAIALYRRHGDEHWRELGQARAVAESLVVPASAMRRSSGELRIAVRESNFHSDEVPLTIR